MSNSLGNISNINLDSFKTDATYYLSKSGEVKKAGLWFNFKLRTNIGNSRNKVIDLLNAVKNKMLSATNSASSIREFEDSIKNSIKKDKYNVKLSTLLQNFKASNADCIHGEKAKKMAEYKAACVADRIPCDNSETRKELRTFLFESLSSFYDNPPLKNSEDGKGQVLDKERFVDQMNCHFTQIKRDLMQKLQLGGTDEPKLDSLYLKYYKENMFAGEDLVNIKPKKDAFADSLVSNLKHLGKEQFPKIAEHLKSVLDETKDGLLKNILTNSVNEILVKGNADLRTLDEVKEKIENIKNNFNHIINNCTNDTSKKIAGLFLRDVGIKKLEEGSAQKLFEMIKSEAPKLSKGIGENTSPEELSKLMGNIQLSIDKIAVETGILYDNAEDTKEAVRQFILGEMMSNLSPDDQEKVINMTNSLSFTKVHTILNTYTGAVLDEQDFTEDEELCKQLGQKSEEGRLLMKVMESLKFVALTVAKPNNIYIPYISMENQPYVGIDMKSEMANTVLENSGMNSDKFKDSRFLNLL